MSDCAGPLPDGGPSPILKIESTTSIPSTTSPNGANELSSTCSTTHVALATDCTTSGKTGRLQWSGHWPSVAEVQEQLRGARVGPRHRERDCPTLVRLRHRVVPDALFLPPCVRRWIAVDLWFGHQGSAFQRARKSTISENRSHAACCECSAKAHPKLRNPYVIHPIQHPEEARIVIELCLDQLAKPLRSERRPAGVDAQQEGGAVFDAGAGQRELHHE